VLLDLFSPPPPDEATEARLLREIRAGGGRFDRLVITSNRRVMISIAESGRTIRIHRVFRDAPPAVLAAVGRLYSSTSGRVRSKARTEIRRFLTDRIPSERVAGAPRGSHRPPPSDRPFLELLHREFAAVNAAFFRGSLPKVPLRLSGRMRRRNGHFGTDPLEIAISRRLCLKGAEGEAERTLRHEMIHLWQYVEGRKPGHGADFRRWARRLGIHPRATRSVTWTDEAG
jgi:SprT-like family